MANPSRLAAAALGLCQGWRCLGQRQAVCEDAVVTSLDQCDQTGLQWHAPLAVRHVLCCSGVSSVPPFAPPAPRPPPEIGFVGFVATMAGSDPSAPFIIGFGSSPSRYGPLRLTPPGRV